MRCIKCIMDNSDPDIDFDENGICNHCQKYEEEVNKRVFVGKEATKNLISIIEKIKSSGKKKKYDCIIGLSGGVDSSYVAHIVKENGLNPLAIHFDNGWNSELAVNNIENIIDKLNIDLYTYVINWREFKEMQKAFFKADVPDVEVLTDHAIGAILFREAKKRNIKYIISGSNYASESSLPSKWSYGHADWKYIKSIQKKYNKFKFKTYPHYTIFDLFYLTFIHRIKSVGILNYIDYDKFKAQKLLENNYNWRPYGGKHYESSFTKIFQGYILPKKFNVDKRIVHYSDLIRSKQFDRDKALKIIKNEPPLDHNVATKEIKYLCKKLDYSNEHFDELMARKPKSFNDYPNNFKLIQRIRLFLSFLRKNNFYSK